MRTSNFTLVGSHTLSLSSVGNSKFALDKVMPIHVLSEKLGPWKCAGTIKHLTSLKIGVLRIVHFN